MEMPVTKPCAVYCVSGGLLVTDRIVGSDIRDARHKGFVGCGGLPVTSYVVVLGGSRTTVRCYGRGVRVVELPVTVPCAVCFVCYGLPITDRVVGSGSWLALHTNLWCSGGV